MSPRRNRKKDFPAWHPDFRIAEDLPDIKAVRTGFLVNLTVLGLAFALLVWLVYREAVIHANQSDIETLRDEERSMRAENKQVGDLNTRFMKRKQVHDDLVKFYDAPFDVPALFKDIARIRPGEIAFEEISYAETERAEKEAVSRSYRLLLRGQTRSLRIIDELKDALVSLPSFDDVEPTITEGANPRNAALDTFGFSIEVRFTPDGKKEGA
ncbi:MAG: hypothetical protein ACLFRP_00065 [Puniceicoccaceae bacterium]